MMYQGLVGKIQRLSLCRTFTISQAGHVPPLCGRPGVGSGGGRL